MQTFEKIVLFILFNLLFIYSIPLTVSVTFFLFAVEYSIYVVKDSVQSFDHVSDTAPYVAGTHGPHSLSSIHTNNSLLILRFAVNSDYIFHYDLYLL